MANLPEVDQYDTGVYQLETTDPALGGANGIMNTPPKSLVNRTRYLLNRMLDGALSFVVDSGTVNAVAAAFPQPIAALVDGMEVSFRVAISNTGATTLKLTNTGGPTLATLPLYGGDYAALAGGELPAGATVRAKLNLTLNSGNGAWVIQSVTGGYAKIQTPPVGDMTTKAANMAALFTAADGLSTVNVGVGADVTLTAAQYGCAILKLTGTPSAPINLLLPSGTTGQWIIWNQQGGTNNITVKPTGGTGVVLPQGNAAAIVCSDGAVASFASAQAGQVSFTAVPLTGVTGTTLTVPGGYTPGAIMIEKNGAWLQSGDFTATTSPTITLTTAAVSTDKFTVYRFNTFNVANAVQKSGDVMAGALALYGGDTGVTPAAGDNSTLLATTAFAQGFVGGRKKVVTASTTWTVPAGVTSGYFSGCAPGGGGASGGPANNGTTNTVGAGGGGGGAGQSIQRVLYALVPGSTVTFTLGSPGTGATSPGAQTTGNSGGSGGTLAISGSGFNGGTTVTLSGGSGGGGGSTAASGSAAGGVGGAGYPAGSYGGDATPSNASGNGGAGASGPFGGGGGAGRGASGGSLAGAAANGYGAGGGGGGGLYTVGSGAAGAGGNGAPGFLVIEY
jgi:hypothetical protein